MGIDGVTFTISYAADDGDGGLIEPGIDPARPRPRCSSANATTVGAIRSPSPRTSSRPAARPPDGRRQIHRRRPGRAGRGPAVLDGADQATFTIRPSRRACIRSRRPPGAMHNFGQPGGDVLDPDGDAGPPGHQTQLTSSANPATVGQNIAFTAVVTGSASGTPTGTSRSPSTVRRSHPSPCGRQWRG